MSRDLGNTAPRQSDIPTRLLIVQFGNYAEAEHRFARGENENYYAQRYTVDYVASLVRTGIRVRVIALGEDAPLEELPSGVESLGIRLYRGGLRGQRTHELVRMAAEWKPTHLLLQAPIPEMLRWAVPSRIETLPLLADSFRARGIRSRLWYRRLATALNDSAIRWVVNHGANACDDLARIGVDSRKLLPFDWPSFDSPSKWPAKKAPADADAIMLTYVGQITASKGVGDLIEAVAIAKAKGEHYQANLAGRGDIESFMGLASRRGVADLINFIGQVSRRRVLELMNIGDVVVVASRHEYPEGMPQTIYEGLVSRSPVLVSDHPMFKGRIVPRHNAMIFRAADPHSLYRTIHDLVHDSALYERLSRDADLNARNFHGPLKWDQVIGRWLSGTAEDHAWLRQYALSRR
jgi:glycosyltransferase involved in cell wall biosynthesis